MSGAVEAFHGPRRVFSRFFYTAPHPIYRIFRAYVYPNLWGLPGTVEKDVSRVAGHWCVWPGNLSLLHPHH